MTTRALGSASQRTVTARTVSVPSSLTTSVFSLTALQAAQIVPPPEPKTPAQIVKGNVTMIPDSPGFTNIPTPVLSSAVQFDAVRSAANNTAVAYGLDPIYSADAATIEQLTIQQKAIKILPRVTTLQVIIPP
jgi:hypothetical protein